MSGLRTIKSFLYVWLFDCPRTKAGWRWSRFCHAVSFLTSSGWAVFFFRAGYNQSGPPEVPNWIDWVAAVAYCLMALLWAAMLIDGFFRPPAYARGEEEPPLYRDETGNFAQGPPQC